VNNSTVDGDVVAYLSLSSPSAGAELGLYADAAMLIQDDDAIISFTTENYSVNEGAVSGHATIWVQRNGSTNTSLAVVFNTVTNGTTATDGVDFASTNNLVFFAPGEVLKPVTVPVIDDALVEGPESVSLRLSAPQVLNSPSSVVYLGLSAATLTIVDNDFLPGQFVVSARTNFVNEFDGFITITVLRTNGSSGIASVRYSLQNGTAQAGSDYVITSGTLSFADGESAKQFNVLINNDQSIEGDETFFVVLSNPTGGATLGPVSTGTVVIFDDESGVQFESATYGAAEDDGFVRIAVLRSGNTNVNATIGFVTINGSATSPADFLGTNGTLTSNIRHPDYA
jgi:hypothetical protein